MQAYSDPRRENDPHALPNVEVFRVSKGERTWQDANDDGNAMEPGWYWHACFPGCVPDGDPEGPFDSEAEALADAQSGADDDDDGGGEPEPAPRNLPDVWVCIDCMTVAVNGHCSLDTSEERDAAIVDGWIALEREAAPPTRLHWAPNFDGDTGQGERSFSRRPCDCCKSPLFGARYRFTALVREEG